MRTVVVIESEVNRQISLSLAQALIMFEVHLLVFEGAPQALNENVVEGATLAVMLMRM